MAQVEKKITTEDISSYYHIHEKTLGEGGFGRVRLGTHLLTGQTVAVKCLDKIKLGHELPRVYNEIECLKRLRHKNIARLYQVFETSTVIYIVLEYCAGGELFDYIVSKSKLDEEEANKIFHDLIRVLDYIHINGFAHRDLKPENVLLDDKRQIKLIDFGLAANCSAENMAVNHSQQPLDQLSTCCGSVTYAAPEVISGSLYSGTAVDVWSAGVMLFALLVGQLPFNDNCIPKLYQKIQSGIKTLPAFLSADASDLIRKMLTVDPEKRITIRQILAHPWLTRNRYNNLNRVNRRLEFNYGHIDEQLLARCCEKFPHMSPTQLREGIRRDFNHYSTTYHLMRSTNQPLPPPPPIPKSSPIKRSAEIYATPTKRSRFVTVTNTPRTPKTPPSYLRRLQENRPMTADRIRSTPKAKKSIVKRLLESATPKKLLRVRMLQ